MSWFEWLQEQYTSFIAPVALGAFGYFAMKAFKVDLSDKVITAEEYGVQNIVDEYAYINGKRLRLHLVEIDCVKTNTNASPMRYYTYCYKISPRSFIDHEEFLVLYRAGKFDTAIVIAERNKGRVFGGELDGYYDVMIKRIASLQSKQIVNWDGIFIFDK